MQKTILIGNLGNDPELRSNSGGTSVCSFSVATTERWKDQQGNTQEKTEWHRIIAWGALADFCSKYLKKGSKVYIEGKNKTRKWKDQNGVEHNITEIHVKEMENLTPKNTDNGSGNSRTDKRDSRHDNDKTPSGYPTGSGDDVPF